MRKDNPKPCFSKRGYTDDEKKLIRRYLLWCYKTTKEEVDRIDRKFTQLKVDRYILDDLLQAKRAVPAVLRDDYHKLVDDFKLYIQKKKNDAESLKFIKAPEALLSPSYAFLKNRLAAVECAIGSFLGVKELKAIKFLYEEEMTKRILEAREHTQK